MSIVTLLPNVSAQTRAFISGRSKGTWHGDLYTQTGGRGTAGKGGGEKTGSTCRCPTGMLRRGTSPSPQQQWVPHNGGYEELASPAGTQLGI